jgi:hypothetical protein
MCKRSNHHDTPSKPRLVSFQIWLASSQEHNSNALVVGSTRGIRMIDISGGEFWLPTSRFHLRDVDNNTIIVSPNDDIRQKLNKNTVIKIMHKKLIIIGK